MTVKKLWLSSTRTELRTLSNIKRILAKYDLSHGVTRHSPNSTTMEFVSKKPEGIVKRAGQALRNTARFLVGRKFSISAEVKNRDKFVSFVKQVVAKSSGQKLQTSDIDVLVGAHTFANGKLHTLELKFPRIPSRRH